jgi:hypothetical protein
VSWHIDLRDDGDMPGHLFTLGSKKVGYLETKQMVIPCHAGSILNI